jgi:aldehyde dehydrogenase (NAD+)
MSLQSLVPRASLIPDLPTRLIALRRARALIARDADMLVRLMGEEIHKPAFEALAGDVLPLLAACSWHLRRAPRMLRDRRIPGRPLWLPGVRHRLCRAPLGRVAIIATWNYPVQLLGVQIVQAFVAGNALLVKPSERSPRTQALLLDLFAEAGVAIERAEPTREAGERLVRDERFDHLVFTGSTAVGRAIARTLAGRLIPSTLELSGNDTAVVLSSADPKLAARCIWYALTLNHGQTCMAPRRVLVDDSIYQPFLSELAAASRDAEPRRLIDRASTERCRAVVRDALDAGGVLVTGRPDADPLEPIVIAGAAPDSQLFRGEHFGPLLAVSRLVRAGGRPGAGDVESDPLTLSVFGSPAEVRAYAERSRAGSVVINDCIIPTGHPGAPLPASGESGWGVTRGEPGLLAMTKPVSVSVTARWPRVPLTPPAVGIGRITPWLRRLYAAPRTRTRPPP